ncbi:serine hydrolase [Spongiimicrobium salis]|uniref:serine hydrolase n=1 Tax=Spongiimicrobium salis TaxID=1667022 RepID=UPI00374D609B
MKQFHFRLTLVLVLALYACNTKTPPVKDTDLPHIKQLFLKQKPPGRTPEIIAPGIVTTEEHFIGGITFSPDMKAMYTVKKGGKYEDFTPLVIRYEQNTWQEESVTDIKHSVFSKDGNIIYKGNQYKKRTASGWSDFKSLGTPFEDKFIMGISISDQKTIFFSHFNEPEIDGSIRYSRLIDGKYESSQKLGKQINNGKPLGHPYIAPDESYILWDAVREEGYGDSDLYISFKQENGSWGAAINLGAEINTEQSDSGPNVTPDGKYLTFSRGGYTVNEDGSFYVFTKPYWVSTQVIEDLRSKSGTSPEENDASAAEATPAEAAGLYRDIPALEPAFIDSSPADRKDGIPVGKLGVDAGNKDLIIKLAQEIADGQHDKINSLLIAHKGKLLFESYYSKGRIDLPHPQASTTKTYAAMALGRAIQLGYLSMADLHKPLIHFFDGLEADQFTEGVERITLRHALTMTTGIRISDEQREDFKQNPEEIQGRKHLQAILTQSAPISKQSQSFRYGRDGPNLVMQVLEAVVPGSAKDFIENELLLKMGISWEALHEKGITYYDWIMSTSGLPDGASGSTMKSRDMIKWGTLIANKGQWKGEQLVPEAFIDKATSMIIDTGDDDVFGGGKDVSNQGYGYFMWNADLKYGDQSYYSASAQGGGGQFIILIKALDLMIVSTASEWDEPTTLQMTAARILPAFVE